MPEETIVIPAITYGMRRELLPNCRSLASMCMVLEAMKNGGKIILKTKIEAEDKCQRGFDGLPLYRMTPGVQYLTYQEWVEIGEELG